MATVSLSIDILRVVRVLVDLIPSVGERECSTVIMLSASLKCRHLNVIDSPGLTPQHSKPAQAVMQ